MILTSTSDIIRVVTTGIPDIDIQAGWADITTTTFTPGRTNTKIATATTTTIVASPAASTQRQVKTLAIRNIHATDPNTITVQHYDGTTSVDVYKLTLLASESAEYDGTKWVTYNASGIPTTAQSSGGLAVADIGSTAETVGGSVANGAAATASRSDHKHAITNPAIDTLAAATDITTLNASTTAHGLVVKATAPAAGMHNYVGIANAETAYTNNPLFDATDPTTQAFADAAAVGTAAVTARRDHKHAMMAAPTSVSGNAGTVTTNANLTGPITSLGNATAIASQTGTGTKFVVDTSPTLVTPILGTPTSATLTNATGLPIAGLVASTSTAIGVGSVELGHATDTTIARVSAGVISVEAITIPSISSTDTLTNKRVTLRTGTTTSSATPTINTDTVDFYSLTAQAADITSFTTNLTGTPTEGQKLWIAITGTAARAITWGATFEASTIALPTTTVTTARLDVGFIWNTVTSKWRCVGSV